MTLRLNNFEPYSLIISLGIHFLLMVIVSEVMPEKYFIKKVDFLNTTFHGDSIPIAGFILRPSYGEYGQDRVASSQFQRKMDVARSRVSSHKNVNGISSYGVDENDSTKGNTGEMENLSPATREVLTTSSLSRKDFLSLTNYLKKELLKTIHFERSLHFEVVLEKNTSVDSLLIKIENYELSYEQKQQIEKVLRRSEFDGLLSALINDVKLIIPISINIFE